MAAVLGGALLLGTAWLVVAPSTPPLYDGVQFPDEPYRFLTPPSGTAPTKPPTSASADITVKAGKTVAANISTREQGPQAAVYVADQGLAVQGSAAAVTVSLSPVPSSPPADGSIPGNAYRVAASSMGGSVAVSDLPSAVTVLLRIPRVTQARVALEVLVGGRWEQLTTFQTGNDIYSAALPVFGTVAAVLVTAPQRSVLFSGAGPVSGAGGGGGLALGPLIAGGVVLALVLLIVGVRFSRRRGTQAGEPATQSLPEAPPR